MANDQKQKSRLKVTDRPCPHSHDRSETRLVFPLAANREASEAALKTVIDDWLLPRLLQEFLKEKGIITKSRFGTKTSI